MLNVEQVSARLQVQQTADLFDLTGKAREIIGYARDAVIILIIVAGGMYVLHHPEKIDAFLNWMLGRHQAARFYFERPQTLSSGWAPGEICIDLANSGRHLMCRCLTSC